MADITVNSETGFTPSPYPSNDNDLVYQNDTVTFQASGSTSLSFYAQNGLFYWPTNQTQTTNTRNTPLTAPASTDQPPILTLTVAACPWESTTFKLWLNPPSDNNGAEGYEDDSTPPDGTINVSTKSKPTY